MRAASVGIIGLLALCQAHAGQSFDGVWVLDHQKSVADRKPARLILRLESNGSRGVSVWQIRIDRTGRRVQHLAYTIDWINAAAADAEVSPASFVFGARSASAIEEWTVVPGRRLVIRRAVAGSRSVRQERLVFEPASRVPYDPSP